MLVTALGQGVPVKDGVSVPRSNVGALQQGSTVTFGSIPSLPISAAPVVRPGIYLQVMSMASHLYRQGRQ
jgi:translation initiation factor 4G